MQDEIHAIQKNDKWRFATLSPGYKAICDQWMQKVKRKGDGEIDRPTARVVAKCYKQKYSIDYEEVFAIAARLNTTAHDRKNLPTKCQVNISQGILEEVLKKAKVL